MTIGARLREERGRLGMSQPTFAGLAGTTKQTLFSWESGKTAPDGFQLAALAAEGVDVHYILTGQRSGAISSDEQELLALFRAAPLAVKAAAIGALQGAAAQGGIALTQSGSGVQIGHASGTVTVGAPAARKRKGA